MLSWVKFVCLAFSRLKVVSTFLCCGPVNWTFFAPLQPDRYLPWHHCHKLYMFLVHVLEPLGSVEHESQQPESGRQRTSATRWPLRHSRRLAKQTLDCCAWVHQGTIAYNLHIAWKTALFLDIFTCTWWHFRDLLLYHSRLLGLALCLSRSCLSMPPGNPCHAGGWHLRRKPCVELFFVSSSPVAFSHLGSVLLSLACPTAFVLWTSTSRRGP